MKISVITPSFNQAEFIGKTIRSVLAQEGEFELEYIIVDGQSSDGSVDIIRQFSETDDRITWVSEPDRGQIDAINKGLELSTGDLQACLNSDDLYLPGTLSKVAAAFRENPGTLWLYGKCHIINRRDAQTRRPITLWKNLLLKKFSLKKLLVVNFVSQPSTFWSRKAFDLVGNWNPELDLAMDYEYWCRLAQHADPLLINDYLAAFRVYPETKTMDKTTEQLRIEHEIASQYTSSTTLLHLHRVHNLLNITMYRLLNAVERLLRR